MIDNKRIRWMDFARTFAIISVILCHSVESVYSMNMEEWNVLSSLSKIFNIVSHTAGRLGVPIFIFLSGALLLSKDIDRNEDVIKFYKHNLLPLFLAVEIWNIIYDIFLYTFKLEEIKFTTVINNLLFFEQVKMSHMWYMPMILGIYLAVPFVAYIIKKFSGRVLAFPIIIVFVASIIVPNTNIVFTMLNKPIHNIILDLSYCGGVYGVYLILGYYVNKNILKNISTLKIILGALAFYVFTVVFQIYINNNGLNYHVWYDFLGLFLTTLFIFEIFHRMNINNNIIVNVTRYISSISLGMYFIHRPIQMLLCKYISFNGFKMSVSVIIIWVITVILSVFIISILKKISFFSKWLFIIK